MGVVMDDALWHSKTIYDVVFDELHHIRCLDFFHEDSFPPLGEVISYCQYKAMAPG